MCRLFGFRSVIPSQVHNSLVGAENALARQGVIHADGWGVAYYHGGSPHVIKSVQSAVNDTLFQRLSGVVSSETVIAHLRKATVGEMSILDTHPFQFGKWVFAHNGNVKNFGKLRDFLVQKISPNYRRFLLGKTDSEIIFLLIISKLTGSGDPHRPNLEVEQLIVAAKEALVEICSLTEVNGVIDGEPTDSYFSFIMTNGQTMLGHHGGQSLHMSTFKTLCSQRKTCAFLSESCEKKTKTGRINHLLFASEPLSGENVWSALDYGSLCGVDHRMVLVEDRFDYDSYIEK